MDVRPEKGRATDDSTGRDLWQNRPVETSWTEGSSSPTPSRSVAKSVSVGSLRRLVVFPESPASRTNHPAVPSVCGAGVLEHDRARASAGWVKARQRSAASSPEHSERSERPRSGEGASARDSLDGAVVRFAEDAACCGALGCRKTSGLVEVENGGEKRVLCLSHARGWVQR